MTVVVIGRTRYISALIYAKGNGWGP